MATLARIITVSDSFDAMASNRPYRNALPLQAAVQELERNKESQFDPGIVEAFLAFKVYDGVIEG